MTAHVYSRTGACSPVADDGTPELVDDDECSSASTPVAASARKPAGVVSMEQERNRLRSEISRHPRYREDRRSFLGSYDGLGALPKSKLVALALELGIDASGIERRGAPAKPAPAAALVSPPSSPSTPGVASCAPSLADGSSTSDEEAQRPRRHLKEDSSASHTKSSSSVWVAMRNALRSAISKHAGYLQNRRHFLRGYPALSHLPRSDLVAVANELNIDLAPFGVVANSSRGVSPLQAEDRVKSEAVDSARGRDDVPAETTPASKTELELVVPNKRRRTERTEEVVKVALSKPLALSVSAVHVSSASRGRPVAVPDGDVSWDQSLPSLSPSSSLSPSGRSAVSSSSSRTSPLPVCGFKSQAANKDREVYDETCLNMKEQPAQTQRPPQRLPQGEQQQSLPEQKQQPLMPNQQQLHTQLRQLGIDLPQGIFPGGLAAFCGEQYMSTELALTPSDFGVEGRQTALGLGTAEALGLGGFSSLTAETFGLYDLELSSPFAFPTPRPIASPKGGQQSHSAKDAIPEESAASSRSQEHDVDTIPAVQPSPAGSSNVVQFLSSIYKPQAVPPAILQAFKENSIDMEVVRSSHFTADLLIRLMRLPVVDAMRIIQAR